MRREEDFQRTKYNHLKEEIPLINIFENLETFKGQKYPNEKLCVLQKEPVPIQDEGFYANHER